MAQDKETTTPLATNSDTSLCRLPYMAISDATQCSMQISHLFGLERPLCSAERLCNQSGYSKFCLTLITFDFPRCIFHFYQICVNHFSMKNLRCSTNLRFLSTSSFPCSVLLLFVDLLFCSTIFGIAHWDFQMKRIVFFPVEIEPENVFNCKHGEVWILYFLIAVSNP